MKHAVPVDIPIVEYINDVKGFQWRLRMIHSSDGHEEVTGWNRYYKGILIHKFQDGRIFMVVTDYWEDDRNLLPALTPLEIRPTAHIEPVEIKRV